MPSKVLQWKQQENHSQIGFFHICKFLIIALNYDSKNTHLIISSFLNVNKCIGFVINVFLCFQRKLKSLVGELSKGCKCSGDD